MAKQFRLGRATGWVALGLVTALSLPRRAEAAPLFSDATFGSLGLPQTACADTGDLGCNTNWFMLTDVDQDGDFDILMANGGALFAPGNQAEESLLYLNDGHAAFFDATNQKFSGAHSQARQVAVGDVNGDGLLDVFQPSGYGTEPDMLWIRDKSATGVSYIDQAATNLPLTPNSVPPVAQMSHASAAHFGDLDGDGDLDLVIADWGTGDASTVSRLLLYINDGTGVFSLVETQKDAAAATDHFPSTIPATNTAPYYGARPMDLDFVDVDGDFDLDILINHRDGQSRIFLNDGHANFSDGTGFNGTSPDGITANYPPKQGPYSYNQEACDLDEDGDLDLIVDDAGKTPSTAPNGNGTNVTQVLINDGHGVFTDDTANRIVGEPASIDSSVKCADVNGDGHYDIVVGSRTNNATKVLLNNGSGVFSYAAGAVPSFTNTTIAIDVADLDGDGRLDLVTGQGEGTITPANTATLRNNRVYLNTGAVDTTPPVFRAIEKPIPVVGATTVFRVAVRDSATNEAGQMATVSAPYTIKGITRQAKVAFVGGDLFRIEIPAQVDGTVATVTPTAVDHAKLTTTATPIVLTFGTPPDTGEGGAGGDTTTPGAAGSTEPSAEAGSAGDTTTVTTGGASGSSNGGSAGKASAGSGNTGKAGAVSSTDNGGAAGEDSGEAGSSPSPVASGDGCNCSMLPATQGKSTALLGLGLAMLGLVRRRRHGK